METWIKIKGYEDQYEVSNLGDVRSIERVAWNGKVWHKIPKRILKPNTDGKYLMVSLCKNNKAKKFRIHKLVAEAFLEVPEDIIGKLEIDHINNIKIDNRLENLKYISQRENTIKGVNKSNKSSKYTGVCWHKNHKKWMSSINMKDYKNTKYFNDELEASEWYKKEVENYEKTRNNREVTFS